MSKQKILFIDRDGTLIAEPTDKQVDSLEKLELEPNVIPVLLKLQQAGYQFVLVSNQDGLGTNSFPIKDFELVQNKFLQLFSSQGIFFVDIKICPHFESDRCDCRKPKMGLVIDYVAMENLDRQRSYVIGDRSTDLELAKNMRLPGYLYDRKNQNWLAFLEIINESNRQGVVNRITNETQISVRIDLDKAEPIAIKTGLGFFDHMLEQFAKHSGISVQITAEGDLHIDEHHLVEDVAIGLGSALRQALGDKLGIQRYGFALPMDDAVAQMTLDLSGRNYFSFTGHFKREQVGELPTELVPHFFRSLCEQLAATLHIQLTGENDHHQIESLFKCFGRVFRQAKQIEGISLPSTKGIL